MTLTKSAERKWALVTSPGWVPTVVILKDFQEVKNFPKSNPKVGIRSQILDNCISFCWFWTEDRHKSQGGKKKVLLKCFGSSTVGCSICTEGKRGLSKRVGCCPLLSKVQPLSQTAFRKRNPRVQTRLQFKLNPSDYHDHWQRGRQNGKGTWNSKGWLLS